MNESMSRAEYKRLNNRLIPYNIVIAVISAVCIVLMLTGTFWSFSINYKANDILQMVASGFLSDGEGEGGLPIDNLSESFAEFDDLELRMKLTIPSSVLLGTLGGDKKAAVTDLVASVTGDLMTSVTEIFPVLMKAVMRIAYQEAVKQAQAAIDDQLPDNIENVDMTGLNEIADLLLSGDKTVEEIKTEISAIIRGEIDKIAPGLDAEARDELLAELDVQVAEAVDSLGEALADDNGYINMENMVMDMVKDILPDLGIIESENASEQLAALIVQEMGDDGVETVFMVMTGLAVVLLVTVGVWGLLLLFAVLRIFTKKKGVYLGNARGWGWVPFSVLVILPWALFTAASTLLQSEMAALSGLSLVFSSVTAASFIGAVALMVLNWFGYRRIKRQIKRAHVSDYA